MHNNKVYFNKVSYNIFLSQSIWISCTIWVSKGTKTPLRMTKKAPKIVNPDGSVDCKMKAKMTSLLFKMHPMHSVWKWH